MRIIKKTISFIIICLISNFIRSQDGQKVNAPDSQSGDMFGCSVSVAGDYALIGAFYANNFLNSQDYTGAAYFYKKVNNNWEFTQKLQENNIFTYARYGFAIDMDTNGFAIVGAYGDGTGFIYKLIDGQFIKQYQLPDHYGSELGFSVAIDNKNVIIGAPNGKGLGQSYSNRGEAWIYHYDQSSWTEVQKIAISDGFDNAHLGNSVDISGDFAIVGAWTDGDYPEPGSAHIFKNQNGTWLEFQKLLPNELDTLTNSFGKCVAIKGDYAIVGAPDAKITDSIYGAAYVFKNNGQNWVQASRLIPPLYPTVSSRFGRSLNINENTLIVGGLNAVYIYSKLEDNWVFQKAIYHDYYNNGYSYYNFASTVSCSEDNLVVGAFDDCDNGSLSGAAHFYQISSLTTSLKSKNINPEVEIYPNPFKSDIIVKLNNSNINSFNIHIINSIGLPIKTYTLIDQSIKGINLNEVPPGIYFIRIESAGGIVSKKIIKE
jgi:hypothetical protein